MTPATIITTFKAIAEHYDCVFFAGVTAERHLSGADKGIELAAIGRRTCEMEFEAMRLIEDAR